MATVKWLDNVTVSSHAADGASAVAFQYDTDNALSTAGAKLASWSNNGTEKAYIDKDGWVYSRRFVWTDDPPNRYHTSDLWKNNLGVTIDAADIYLKPGYGSARLQVRSETIDTVTDCIDLNGDVGKHFHVHALDSDGIADRLAGTLYLEGGGSHASNTTNIDGGNVDIKGGAANHATGDGGDVVIAGGATTGGVDGKITLSSVFNVNASYTVSGLPTGAVGDVARVTDASSPSVGSTVSSGGSAAALCWYNGSNWTVIGV
jgi:hypothetical protein